MSKLCPANGFWVQDFATAWQKIEAIPKIVGMAPNATTYGSRLKPSYGPANGLNIGFTYYVPVCVITTTTA